MRKCFSSLFSLTWGRCREVHQAPSNYTFPPAEEQQLIQSWAQQGRGVTKAIPPQFITLLGGQGRGRPSREGSLTRAQLLSPCLRTPRRWQMFLGSCDLFRSTWPCHKSRQVSLKACLRRLVRARGMKGMLLVQVAPTRAAACEPRLMLRGLWRLFAQGFPHVTAVPARDTPVNWARKRCTACVSWKPQREKTRFSLRPKEDASFLSCFTGREFNAGRDLQVSPGLSFSWKAKISCETNFTQTLSSPTSRLFLKPSKDGTDLTAFLDDLSRELAVLFPLDFLPLGKLNLPCSYLNP